MMNIDAFFEPTFAAYVRYCIGYCLRYFAIAGSLYVFFHLAFKRHWFHYRIQSVFPSRGDVGHEIRWSMTNAACTGLATIWLYHLIHAGKTQMYFVVADYGWVYFLFSIVLGIVGYDAWFYFQHRLLHTPWLFRHAHSIHHRVANPTAFATFALHPIETFMGNAFFILLVMLIPLHPLALTAALAFIYLVGVMAHTGYEFYPSGFTRHRLFQWCNTSTHHNMHHSHVGCNYGLFFNYWDRLLGTNHVAYLDTFDAVTARRYATRRSGTVPIGSTAALSNANPLADG